MDELRERLETHVGRPMGPPAEAPDPVNVPMIRHWVDALDDRNPVYLDEDFAKTTRFGGTVAPPAMLQAWTMPRPKIEGIAERGGAPGEVDPDSPLRVLDAAGYVGTLATNSELEFARYLRPGEALRTAIEIESISERKTTGLGQGYFVTWVTTYTDAKGDVVGRQRFRILKFDPSTIGQGTAERGPRGEPKPEPAPIEALPDFDLPVTATLVVAGAIASRDFMPVHHDRDYAKAQGAPDIFMNILTTNGYVARYATDWAGAEARLRRIAIRLGGPAIPGHVLRFGGIVVGEERRCGELALALSVKAVNALGMHASGTVSLTLPASR